MAYKKIETYRVTVIVEDKKQNTIPSDEKGENLADCIRDATGYPDGIYIQAELIEETEWEEVNVNT